MNQKTTDLSPLLKKMASQGRIASSYLFVGMGAKELLHQALLFCKKLNPGQNSENKIDKHIHPDVKLIESHGEAIKIEPLRELQKELHLKPYEGQWKIVVIDGAEHLTTAASNSLLKILEEPPAQTTFILLTGHMENILQTVISRCHILRITNTLAHQLPDNEHLHSLLSLPTSTIERLELAKTISEDEELLNNCLETWISWYHDLIFYKQGVEPLHSPLKDKAILAQTLTQQLSIESMHDKLGVVLKTKRDLRTNVNKLLITEHLLDELAR